MTEENERKHELGERLSALRERAGSPRWSSVYRHVIEIAGPDSIPSDQTILNMHAGKVDPYKASPEALVALAEFYGGTIDDLGEAAPARLHALESLLRTGRGCALGEAA